jgi:hypothetical protein
MEHEHADPPPQPHVSLALADLRLALYASYLELAMLDPLRGLPEGVERDLRQLAAQLDQVLHQARPRQKDRTRRRLNPARRRPGGTAPR